MTKIAPIAYLATATAALAHPGHGAPAGHWATSADHIIALIVIAVAGGLILARRRDRE